MCLYISDKSTELVEKARKKNKPILGYKILKRGYAYDPKKVLYRSFWRRRTWEKNKTSTYISNRKSTSLTNKEETLSKISEGFHFYQTRKVARGHKLLYEGVIVQFEIDPKNLVAFGGDTWCYGGQFVATRCKMIKEVR